jgi:WD40 repeat protein
LTTARVTAVAFSPNGKTIASANMDGTARLSDLATHRQLGASMTASTDPLWALAFSPDGKMLATGSEDGTARLWDLATHHQAGVPLVASRIRVLTVAFSPDGRFLVTANGIAAQLWNVSTDQQIGAPLSVPGGGDSGVNAAAFSPSGKTIATVGNDGTARLWGAAFPADLLAATCTIAGRSVTIQEWNADVQSQPFQQTCP